MWANDGDLQNLCESLRSPGMIDMAVREQDLRRPQGLAAQGFEKRLHIAARIDDGSFLAVAVPDYRTILLEGRYRNDDRLWLRHDAYIHRREARPILSSWRPSAFSKCRLARSLFSS